MNYCSNLRCLWQNNQETDILSFIVFFNSVNTPIVKKITIIYLTQLFHIAYSTLTKKNNQLFFYPSTVAPPVVYKKQHCVQLQQQTWMRRWPTLCPHQAREMISLRIGANCLEIKLGQLIQGSAGWLPNAPSEPRMQTAGAVFLWWSLKKRGQSLK